MAVFKFTLIIICQVLGTLLFSILDKKTKFGKLNKYLKSSLFGIGFGLLSILGSEQGINVNGAIMNVRDAAPLTAGLFFGLPAGVIAGFMGGLERYLAVNWGAGTYTQLACSISTFLAGILAGFLRRKIFERRHPRLIFSIGIAVCMEVIHMLMVFIFKMNDSANAYQVIKSTMQWMILTNAISVGLSSIVVRKVFTGHFIEQRHQRTVIERFSMTLMTLLLVCFITTETFTFFVQDNIAINDASTQLITNINDLKLKVNDESDANLLNINHLINNEIEEYTKLGNSIDNDYLTSLSEKYQIYSISFINNKGIIEYANLPDFIGFDMNSGAQSQEFLVLLTDEVNEFVQAYQPISMDSKKYLKFSGVKYLDGFIQIGYNDEEFQNDLAYFVTRVANHWHIGKTGFIFVVNQYNTIVSDSLGHAGTSYRKCGLNIDDSDLEELTIYKDYIYDEECFYLYTKSEGYKIIAGIPITEVYDSRNLAIYLTICMEIITFVALFILITFWTRKNIANNISNINEDLASITSGNLNTVLKDNKIVEFSSLSKGINQTVDRLKGYISEASQRIDKELEFAKNIQHSALPSVFPPYPTRKEFSIFATMDTAKEVGGDFYDFFFIGGSKIAFLIADVSGKGIPGAMFMMQSKTIIKSYGESKTIPAKIFTQANNRLCENNEAGMFVTALLGVLDLYSGELELVNAGHNPSLIKRKDGTYEYLKVKAGFVLAGWEGFEYKSQTIKMEPGDMIYFYTDGVTEACNLSNELYGEERLQNCLNAHLDSNVEETCKLVKEDVDKFVGDAEQFDDITMLCFKFEQYMGEKAMKELVVDAKVENIDKVTAFVDTELENAECSMKAQTQIDVAIDEIFSNIAYYAYKGQTNPGKAKIRLGIEENVLTLIFMDEGIMFNPLEKDNPDTTLSADDRQIGGLGIYIVKKTMDEVDYRYQNNMNILTIKKTIK